MILAIFFFFVESNGVVPVAEDCTCGIEDCDEGNYCHEATCSPDPYAFVEDVWESVSEKCMCGPNRKGQSEATVCSGYCFDGICEEEARGKFIILFVMFESMSCVCRHSLVSSLTTPESMKLNFF